MDKKNYVKDVYKSFNSFAITLSIALPSQPRYEIAPNATLHAGIRY